MKPLQIVLSIDNHGKAIPYGAVQREDSVNHGFQLLRGRLDEIANVAEAKDVPAYQAILRTLNADKSPFFSIGCEKSFNAEKLGHWIKGYIEFAFNNIEWTGDAAAYFPLFFHFDRYAKPFVEKNQVQFAWELQGAHFAEANCDGFSCTIWITTEFCQTAETARVLWDSAIEVLNRYFAGYEKLPGTPIYSA